MFWSPTGPIMSHIGTHLPHPKHRTSTFSRKIAFGRRGWKVTVTSLRRLVHGPSTGQQNWERKCYGISSRLDGFRSKTSTVFGSLRISLVEPSPFCPSVSGSAAKAHWESCWPQWIKPGYWWGFNLHPNGCLKMGHSIPINPMAYQAYHICLLGGLVHLGCETAVVKTLWDKVGNLRWTTAIHLSMNSTSMS